MAAINCPRKACSKQKMIQTYSNEKTSFKGARPLPWLKRTCLSYHQNSRSLLQEKNANIAKGEDLSERNLAGEIQEGEAIVKK